MKARRPQLDAEQLALLPDGFADVPARFCGPDKTLHELVCKLSWDRAWLEAGVRGGFVPSVEGMVLAVWALVLLLDVHRADHHPEDCPDTDSSCLEYPAYFGEMARHLLRAADSAEADASQDTPEAITAVTAISAHAESGQTSTTAHDCAEHRCGACGATSPVPTEPDDLVWPLVRDLLDSCPGLSQRELIRALGSQVGPTKVKAVLADAVDDGRLLIKTGSRKAHEHFLVEVW